MSINCFLFGRGSISVICKSSFYHLYELPLVCIPRLMMDDMNCLCLSNFNYLIVIFIICISESYGSSSKDFGRDHLLALAFLRRLDSEVFFVAISVH